LVAIVRSFAEPPAAPLHAAAVEGSMRVVKHDVQEFPAMLVVLYSNKRF